MYVTQNENICTTTHINVCILKYKYSYNYPYHKISMNVYLLI